MSMRRLAVLTLLVGIAAPSVAERLRIEGTFTTYQECGFGGRGECPDPVSVLVPFAFAVNVPFGITSGTGFSERSDHYAPPRYTPALAMAKLGPDEASFLSLAQRVRSVSESYVSQNGTAGVRWTYQAGQSWQGLLRDVAPLTSSSISESLDFQVIGGPVRPGSQPVSFVDLLATFDRAIASRALFVVNARGASEEAEVGDPSSPRASSTFLSGSFRIVALECRTPVGKLEKLAALFGR